MSWADTLRQLEKEYGGSVQKGFFGPEASARLRATPTMGRISESLSGIHSISAKLAALRGKNPSYLGSQNPARQTAGTNPLPTAPLEPVVDEATLEKQRLAAELSKALRGQGIDWNYQVGGSYAPPSSMLGGQAWTRVKNMPTLFMLLKAAASQKGRSEADYMAEVNAFAHQGPQYPTTTWR